MRILFIGDCINNTGPSNVNKLVKQYFPKNTLYIIKPNSIVSVFKLLSNIIKVDIILISGLSKINILALLMSKFLNKKSAYLMHGCVEYESKINRINNPKGIKLEKANWRLVDLIICVSENFEKWFNSCYDMYTHKTTYVNNGVQWELRGNVYKQEYKQKDKIKLMTIGGGIPLKNVLKLCEAIERIIQDTNLKVELTVLGRNEKDTEKIKEYNFVRYRGKISKKEVIEEYKRTDLFIQNSIFESFGLSPIEALMCGANILVSKQIGAISIINDIKEEDLIINVNDINEIKKKIIGRLKESNNERLINSIDVEKTTYKYTAQEILYKLKQI